MNIAKDKVLAGNITGRLKDNFVIPNKIPDHRDGSRRRFGCNDVYYMIKIFENTRKTDEL
jgi:hypothetical protein